MKEPEWQVGHLMSQVDRMDAQITTIWRTLERWDAEQSRDQATIRAMLAVIALLLVALGAGILWSEDRAHARAEGQLHALEMRVDRLESAVAGGD
jgi:hypothetical protein